MTSRLMEVEGFFKDTFLKYFTKIMVGQDGPESHVTALPLLVAIFKQNYLLLSKYEKDLNSMLLHYYQQQLKAKRKIPDDVPTYIYR